MRRPRMLEMLKGNCGIEGEYLDDGNNLYNNSENSMNKNPKAIVKRDNVTTPMNVRTIPTTKSEMNTRYFLFSFR